MSLEMLLADDDMHDCVVICKNDSGPALAAMEKGSSLGAAARGGGLEREADEARDAARVWKASASGWRKGSTMGCESTRRRWRGRVRERIEGAGRVHSYVESAE